MATRNYRGNSSEARRLERRERLLDAARKVFGERGFHNATVRMICEEAGLTERYFYESFPNSEALFIAMHKNTSLRIIRVITEAADACPGTTVEKVRALVLAYFLDIQKDPVSARLFAIDAGHISNTAREVCGGWRQGFGLILSRTFGDDSNSDETVLRGGVVRALLGMGVDWMEGGFATPSDQMAEAGLRIAMTLQRPGPITSDVNSDGT